MTFTQIETFYWVARLGGISAAARHLNTSQPGVSARMRQLESDLGVRLLERSRRGARLTERGQALLEEAEQLIARIGQLRHRIGDPGTVMGTIRLGVAEMIAVTWLATLVSRLNESWPRMRLDLDVDLTLNLMEKLKAGRLDVVLLPGPIADSTLMRHPLGTIRFAWMASPCQHPRAGAPLRPVDLAAWPILTLSRQSNLHMVLENWFARGSAELRRIDVCNSLTVLTEMVAAGLGLGYLSITQTRRLREAGQLVVLETTPPIADLEYLAVYPRRGAATMAGSVASAAQATSTFSRDRQTSAD